MGESIIIDEISVYPEFVVGVQAKFRLQMQALIEELLRQLFVSKVRISYRTHNKARRSTVRRMRRKWHGG